MTVEAIAEAIDMAREYVPPGSVTALTIAELLSLEIPPREYLLSPILQKQGLAMIYSKRGVGKTHLALGISYAVASGGSFLRWTAATPRRVLHIDGEMPLSHLQQRMAATVAGAATAPPEDSFLRLIAADHQRDGIPDLATAAGQEVIEKHIAAGVDLIVLDNLSTLCAGVSENEADAWSSMQGWLLKMRRRGISVLFCHHAGKGGTQRGTSRREDVLDTVIALKHPDGYKPADGARFEVHFEKDRGFLGDDAQPFEARFEIKDGKSSWSMGKIEDKDQIAIAELLNEELSIRELAGRLGISKSAAQRRRAAATDIINA